MNNPVLVYQGLLAVTLAALVSAVLWLLRVRRQFRHMQTSLDVEREVDVIQRSRAAAEGFYDNVLEADITHDRLLGQNALALTELLHLPSDASFTVCIDAILDQFVKEPYREQYGKNFDRQTLLDRFAAGEKKFSFEFEERADLVRYCWTRVTVCIYYSKASDAVKIISYVKNIQAEKEKELHLQQEANTDYLTGLYNKRAAEPMACRILDQCRGSGCAMLIVDVDHFKQVNDSVGHVGGDALLWMTAQFLQRQMDPADLVARIGGDEFLILMRNCAEAAAACEKAAQLIRLCAEMDTAAYQSIPLTLSIGIALCPAHADHYTDLFNLADSALYEAKRKGRNQYSMAGHTGTADCGV